MRHPSHPVKTRLRFLAVAAAAVFLLHAAFPAKSLACTPGEYQTLYEGILYGIKLKDTDQLRIYLVLEEETTEDTSVTTGTSADDATAEEEEETEPEDVLLGSTEQGFGSLRVVMNRIEFGVRACGDSSLNGSAVEFRYVRNNGEYICEVTEGEAIFEGLPLEIGQIPEAATKELTMKVTRRRPFIESPDGEIQAAPGDVNKDGKVDSSDAAMVLHYVLFEGGDDDTYDVNQDGAVNRDDVRAVYRIQSGTFAQASPSVTAAGVLHQVLFAESQDLRYDQNDDGVVDLADVKLFYTGSRPRDFGAGLTGAAAVIHHILFEDGDDPLYDVNKDGVVDMADVREMYREGEAPDSDADFVDAASVLHHILYEGGTDLRYDVNGDGTVDREDVKVLFRTDGEPAAATTASVPVTASSALHHLLFESADDLRYDANGDGRVTMDDVRLLYRAGK